MTEIPNTDHFLFKLPKYRPKNWHLLKPSYFPPPPQILNQNREGLLTKIKRVFLHIDGNRVIRVIRYSVFANNLDGISVIWIKNGHYSVFQSPIGDGKIQFLIEKTTVTVFMQKFEFGITVVYEKINGNTEI